MNFKNEVALLKKSLGEQKLLMREQALESHLQM